MSICLCNEPKVLSCPQRPCTPCTCLQRPCRSEGKRRQRHLWPQDRRSAIRGPDAAWAPEPTESASGVDFHGIAGRHGNGPRAGESPVQRSSGSAGQRGSGNGTETACVSGSFAGTALVIASRGPLRWWPGAFHLFFFSARRFTGGGPGMRGIISARENMEFWLREYLKGGLDGC